MKFRLSSLLLTVTIVALCTAWYLERSSVERRLNQERSRYDNRIDEIWGGVATQQDVWQLICLSRSFKYRINDAGFEAALKSELIWGMIDLWRHEHKVNIALDDDATFAVTFGNDILKILDCDAADDFFDLARKSDGYDGENIEIFPEIHDPDSDQYKSFRDFVDRSATTDHPTDWKQDVHTKK